MNIRKLKSKDAYYMLEWMQDIDVTSDLQADFASKTIEDVNRFIENSQDDRNNIHLAIASAKDEYMGTVSLKNINNKCAEFAIVIRRKAMGKGYSQYGMEQILKKATDELGLEYVYWCVSPKNKRAVRFYEKNNYKRVDYQKIFINKREYSEDQIKSFFWFKYQSDEDK